MNKILKIIDFDIIFLSYDEPNAEKNFSDLISKVPWAKRVHGVKGSDTAHKICASKSDTEYFVTVDGDNIIDPKFLKLEINLDELGLNDENVFSWCGNIFVNNLMYGNGGLKLWTKKFVNEMKTHENSDINDTKSKVEFCFDNRYYQFNENYSTSYTNASPFQAWRAGFREGVKMSLDQGDRVKNIKDIWWQNYDRLLVWASVGADVENGLWSMYGAREGCYMTNCTDWDYSQVRDFDWLNKRWVEKYSAMTDKMLLHEITSLGNILRDELNLEISELDKDGSKFFKKIYTNSPRVVRKTCE